MKIRDTNYSISKIVCLILYYSIAQFLPTSYTPFVGRMAKWIRYQLCKRIFLHCGKNVNIERFAYFGNGFKIEIGNNSGVGVHCSIPNDIIIGNDVMMGPHCFILSVNHCFSETDIPMNLQGFQKAKRTVIDDDVWISRNVTMTPGRHISRGSIIGACCLLCKDFPEYSIVGGNPSFLIKKRK